MGIKISELPQATSIERGAVMPIVQSGSTQKIPVGDMVEKNVSELGGLIVNTAAFSGTTNANGVLRLGGTGATRKILAVTLDNAAGAYAAYPIQVLADAEGTWFLAVENYQGVRQPDVSISGTVYYI